MNGGKAFDSPRWCAKCQGYGDHHTDRHPAPDGHAITVTEQRGNSCRLDCECGWSKRCSVYNVGMYRSFHRRASR